MIYVFFANGFEEVEAVATVDMLRRAELEVCTVGVGGVKVAGAHGIVMDCDLADTQAHADEALEAVVLPGGMPGTLNLEKSQVVQQFIDYAVAHGKLVAAICAAPSILGHKGLLEGKEATCFPELYGAKLSDRFVCRDGQFITGRGAGVAIDFGLAIAAEFAGQAKADAIRASLQCR
jgi:4-methyl-5(b-hydroxyethyl)-thiazole monophosphate biosynthesis